VRALALPRTRDERPRRPRRTQSQESGDARPPRDTPALRHTCKPCGCG